MQQPQVDAYLVPTSQSAGGEARPNSLAMTAPGSQPVSVPEPQDQAPQTLPLAVDSAPQQSYRRLVRGNSSNATGTWTEPGQPGVWKQV